jgi:hypothetical protein
VPVVAAFWSMWYKSFCLAEIMETNQQIGPARLAQGSPWVNGLGTRVGLGS